MGDAQEFPRLRPAEPFEPARDEVVVLEGDALQLERDHARRSVER
jgi:hypothetical protein